MKTKKFALEQARRAMRFGHYQTERKAWAKCPLCQQPVDVLLSTWDAETPRKKLERFLVEHVLKDCDEV